MVLRCMISGPFFLVSYLYIFSVICNFIFKWYSNRKSHAQLSRTKIRNQQPIWNYSTNKTNNNPLCVQCAVKILSTQLTKNSPWYVQCIVRISKRWKIPLIFPFPSNRGLRLSMTCKNILLWYVCTAIDNYALMHVNFFMRKLWKKTILRQSTDLPYNIRQLFKKKWNKLDVHHELRTIKFAKCSNTSHELELIYKLYF